ncbi:MAG: hypothetical protein EHM42_03560, partial [Planctomycetaceae bacterium]
MRLEPLAGELVTIPIGAVGLVRQPPGELITRFLDAEQRTESRDDLSPGGLGRSSERSWSGEFSYAVQAGDQAVLLNDLTDATATISLVYYDSAQTSADSEWNLRFSTGEAASDTGLTVIPGGSRSTIEVQAPPGVELDTRPISRTSGWHHLRLTHDRGRVVLLVDQQILATAPSGMPAVTALRCEATRSQSPAGTPLAWIDDVIQSRPIDPLPAVAVSGERDSLWLVSGDELFATVVDWNSRSVT